MFSPHKAHLIKKREEAMLILKNGLKCHIASVHVGKKVKYKKTYWSYSMITKKTLERLRKKVFSENKS
jgi:hypothetical protein